MFNQFFITLFDMNNDIQLTPREIQIMYLICEEMTSIEIAEKLFISDKTVHVHRVNLIAKIGCKNVVGIVRFAYDNDYLEPIIQSI